MIKRLLLRNNGAKSIDDKKSNNNTKNIMIQRTITMQRIL